MSVVVVNAQVQTPSNRTPGAADSSSYSKSPSATSGTSIPASDLPQAITDNIRKDYPGYTIKDASSMAGKSGLNYAVNVMKGTTNETLVYDSNGKFLKKMSTDDMKKDDWKK